MNLSAHGTGASSVRHLADFAISNSLAWMVRDRLEGAQGQTGIYPSKRVGQDDRLGFTLIALWTSSLK